jgi:hypothetical protein
MLRKLLKQLKMRKERPTTKTSLLRLKGNNNNNNSLSKTRLNRKEVRKISLFSNRLSKKFTKRKPRAPAQT